MLFLSIDCLQLLPLAPAEAGHRAAELAAVPGAATDGGQDAPDADELGVRAHENKLARAAPPAARRALLLRYRYVQLRHVVSFRHPRMERKRRPLRWFFGGDWYAWTGNARRGRRNCRILFVRAILSE